jgi:hypothetical protein
MAYAHVQDATNQDGAGSSTTMAVTMPGAYGARNTAAVFSHDGKSTADYPTCTDNKGNSYIEVTAARVDDTTNNNKLTAFYANDLGGSGAPTVTLTWAAAQGFRVVTVMEFSGIDVVADPLIGGSGQHQNGPGGGTDAVSSGNINFTAQPAVLAGISYEDSAGNPVPTTGTGFTSEGTFDDASFGYNWEHKRITATGNAAATFTDGSGAGNFNTNAIGLLEGDIPAGAGTHKSTTRLPLAFLLDADDGNKGKFDELDIRGWFG